ncbi:hypothetical protein OUZ56_020249 [Daphnia magna]|uniref:Uncharacterized protein n=1 Tax=Daphnia magna TaxID=35525 RepID=A0ABQ9ZDY5_9CRUS|nr:hypothetical protein OUZ56_020249 [Daphnia magna]
MTEDETAFAFLSQCFNYIVWILSACLLEISPPLSTKRARQIKEWTHWGIKQNYLCKTVTANPQEHAIAIHQQTETLTELQRRKCDKESILLAQVETNS